MTALFMWRPRWLPFDRAHSARPQGSRSKPWWRRIAPAVVVHRDDAVCLMMPEIAVIPRLSVVKIGAGF